MFPSETVPCCEERAERFDRAVEGILVATLAFMPLAFGVVEAWSEEIVLLSAAVLFMCVFLRGIAVGRTSVTWTWAYVPLAAFLIVALIQLVPMPSAWIDVLSPNTVQQKTTLLSDLSDGADLLSTLTLSFYPHATRHDLRLVLAAVAVFVVVLDVYRRPDQIMRLLGAITVIGGGVAVLALLQNVAGNDRIYWCVSSPHGMARSGPFVNHSHYAQFMNLSVGAALGFVFVKVHGRFRQCRVVPAAVADYCSSTAARPTWAAATMAALGAASVFVSMSRGGMMSLLIAGAATVLILSAKKTLKGSGWLMVLLALAALLCVLCVGFDAVHDRLGSLRELQRAEGGRWQIVRDIAVAWTKFPLLGTGLGTHEVVYPMFDRSTVAALASHAENEYAQAAEETGVAGLLALVVFGILVWCDYARAIRAGQVPIHSAAYGLGFGLMAVMIHSLSDFGQHLPANGILSAVFCALLIRLGHLAGDGRAEGGEKTLGEGCARRYGIAGLLVACAVWGWVLSDADAARRSERSWGRALAVEAGLAKRNWQGRADEYTDLVRYAQAAAKCQPDNVTYRYWLAVYRWRALSQTADSETGDILLPPQARDLVARIVEELNDARRCCPTFGPTWSVLGQLERLVLDRPEGKERIQTGYMLAPYDSTTCLLAGSLDAEAGRLDQAFVRLQRAVRLDQGCFAEVARLFVDRLQRPDLALEIAGESPDLAGQLALMLDASAEFNEEVDQRLLELLEQKCREETSPAYWHAMLASLSHRQGNPERAIECYRKALLKNYGHIYWRFHLAQLLSECGFVAEAIREARICLQLSPDFDAARRLIERLSVIQISRVTDS